MSTLGTALSLADVMTRQDPDGSVAPIIETLQQIEPMLGHARWTMCNTKTKHRTTMRTGIPAMAFRSYNEGSQTTKTTTMQVTDTTGMISDYGEVDARLVEDQTDPLAFRVSESLGKLQAFTDFVAHNVFYGNTATDPKGFLGLAPRYSDKSVASGRQIVDAGGTGSDNTSVWLVTWGDQATSLLYPENSPAGFRHKDLGVVTSERADDKKLEVYRDHYEWDVGLTCRDWRGNVRIPNIDVSNLTKDAATGADLIDLMIDAEELLTRVPTLTGTTAYYCNATVHGFLRKQALNGNNVQLRVEDIAGQPVTMFGNYPIYRSDALLSTEARVI
jgi:hypothetical protein